jgi:ABC-type glycerol-3-phosphate transport system substrate-binding protein
MPTGSASPTQTDWTGPIDQFLAGEVAIIPMGTWTKGMLDYAGAVPDVDYDEIGFPSSSPSDDCFVYTADAFAMPVGAASRALAVDFLDTLAGDDAQMRFSMLEGSIPARPIDAALEGQFDPVTRRAIQSYEAALDRRPALQVILPADFWTWAYQALFDFAVSCDAGTCDPTLVRSALVANYGTFQQ